MKSGPENVSKFISGDRIMNENTLKYYWLNIDNHYKL